MLGGKKAGKNKIRIHGWKGVHGGRPEVVAECFEVKTTTTFRYLEV
jgi:hypothetical protein